MSSISDLEFLEAFELTLQPPRGVSNHNAAIALYKSLA